MLEGEFHSMKELSQLAPPNFIPKPHGWGQLTTAVDNPKTYYSLCDFIEFNPQVDPDAVRLCEKLVALHKSSKSPTGMFGLHTKVLRGNIPLETVWPQTGPTKN
ncbi:hypothetical protein B0H63DRAFT_477375 [Podospora didyma]|uniref:Protein-ribulosamine 3-kinase n=1 Tax=Podospora didyma TaxID=330526 RepID=A0AAE0NCE8_9PEZI|nr:hypothetical protein B0H63DRAFT_477375 [Podospora didyma]